MAPVTSPRSGSRVSWPDARGSFVLQHGGLAGGGSEPRSFGSIVPHSGTGALTGLVGTSEFAHDEQGARVTVTYDLLDS